MGTIKTDAVILARVRSCRVLCSVLGVGISIIIIISAHTGFSTSTAPCHNPLWVGKRSSQRNGNTGFVGSGPKRLAMLQYSIEVPQSDGAIR